MRFGNCSALVALSLILHAAPAWPLGLGDARVQSFIGQPLEMRIDLLTAPTDDLDSVTAQLGSADDFAMIGASRGAIGTPLMFSVHEAEGASGAYIQVTSRQPLNEPVLRLVIEVSWSSGRLLREYTVFLDPPTVPSKAPEPVTSRAAEPPGTATTVTDDRAPEVARTAPPPPAAATGSQQTAEQGGTPAAATPESAMEPTAAGETYGPVRSGDTLWRVASNYIGQSGMDMNQVMLAIQRKNPEAFVNDNINLLMRGASLEMPSAEDISEISRDRARELVAQQEAAFRMRSSLASTSTPLLAGDSRPASSTPAPAQREASPEADPVSRLEIVPTSEDDMAEGRPGTGAVPGGEGSEEVDPGLREELARTEEELISERQQNEYLRERINELEAQLAEAEGDADGTVQDSDLANLQDRLQSERLAEASAADDSSAAETSPSMPSVTTTTPSDEGGPWYSGPMIWIILLVILIAAAVGWIVNRRRADAMYFEDEVQSGSAVARLAGEAEEILRTLDSDRQKAAEAGSDAALEGEPEPPEFSISGDATEDFVEADIHSEAVDVEAAADEDDEPVVSLTQARHQQDDGTDARVLDENSSDPEIKLDLARAYISMGDKEAARVILDEVLNLGNKEQRSEAQAMMDEL